VLRRRPRHRDDHRAHLIRRLPHGLRALAVAVASVGGGCGPADVATSGEAGSAVGVGQVVDVIDGDTIDVEIAGSVERVRLLGIDTPEVAHPGKPAECHGDAATAFTEALLPASTSVTLTRDVVGRDHYGRLLAYVHRVDDGVFVNYELARQGHAESLHIAPNGIHRVLIATAVEQARGERLGLWGRCGT
jgi:micrococcal nuclease